MSDSGSVVKADLYPSAQLPSLMGLNHNLFRDLALVARWVDDHECRALPPDGRASPLRVQW